MVENFILLVLMMRSSTAAVDLLLLEAPGVEMNEKGVRNSDLDSQFGNSASLGKAQ